MESTGGDPTGRRLDDLSPRGLATVGGWMARVTAVVLPVCCQICGLAKYNLLGSFCFAATSPPKREDAANSGGGHFQFHFKARGMAILSMAWIASVRQQRRLD